MCAIELPSALQLRVQPQWIEKVVFELFRANYTFGLETLEAKIGLAHFSLHLVTQF
jgi:hypothetical protein